MQEIPTWVIYAVGISNAIAIVSGLISVLIGVALLFVLLQIRGELAGIVKNIHKMTDDGTKITTDAANTSHNVTGAINRVSNLVGTAATKLESPVIRAVGLASGLIAASKSVRGKKTVVVEKRKKGLFG